MVLTDQRVVSSLIQRVSIKPFILFSEKGGQQAVALVASLLVLLACTPTAYDPGVGAKSDGSHEQPGMVVRGTPPSGNDAPTALLQIGKGVYMSNCQVCHGVKGDGKGDYANVLTSRPRDFTTGVFKFRSTPTGSLPTDDDLRRTVLRGIPKSGMPAFDGLREEELRGVIAFIKSFSHRFESEQAEEPLSIPSIPARTFSSVQQGQQLFERMGCVSCHGKTGNGMGPLAPELVDDAGSPILPANLTETSWKGGCAEADLYRSIITGLDGTPMPSFAHQLDPAEAWALVHYIKSLGGGTNPVKAPNRLQPEKESNSQIPRSGRNGSF